MKKPKRRQRTFISTNATAKMNVPKRPQSPLVAALAKAGNSSQAYADRFDASNPIRIEAAKVKHAQAKPRWISEVENLIDYNFTRPMQRAVTVLITEIMPTLRLIHEDLDGIKFNLEAMALFVQQKAPNEQPAKSRDAPKWLRNLISRLQDVFGKSGGTRPGDNDDEQSPEPIR